MNVLHFLYFQIAADTQIAGTCFLAGIRLLRDKFIIPEMAKKCKHFRGKA